MLNSSDVEVVVVCGVGGSGETERDREIENASLMPEVTPWNVFLYGKI